MSEVKASFIYDKLGLLLLLFVHLVGTLTLQLFSILSLFIHQVSNELLKSCYLITVLSHRLVVLQQYY